MTATTLGLVSLFLLAAPPETPRQEVVDVYHGTQVTDEYRWLENWDDPQVQAWSDAQNAYARQNLDRLPNVQQIRERLTEIMSAESVGYSGLACCAGQFFVIKSQPPRQQPFLIVMDSLAAPDEARVLVDPNVLDPEGSTSIDWFEPSPDGRLVAVSMSKSGSEIGDVLVFDTASGRQVDVTIPRVNGGTAGGDLAWRGDSDGFYYTRYPRAGERPTEDMSFYQQAYYHQLGTGTEDDQYVLGKGLPRIAEIEFEVHEPTGTLLITVQDGDGGEFAHYLRDPHGQWHQLSQFADQTIQATFTPEGDLLVVSREGAPRGKILWLPRNTWTMDAAKELIPQCEDTVVNSFYRDPPSLVATAERIYVLYQLGGPSEIRAFDYRGQGAGAPDQAPVSSVGGMVPLGADDLVFTRESYTDPNAYYLYEAEAGRTQKTKLATDSPVRFDDVEVKRVFAASKDGTKVPINILWPKNTRQDGSCALVLNGYGGYGVSLTPRFSATRRIMLENGVAYAVANLRGGGEYGETWHRQGNLTNKQNVFDDFAAAAQYLIREGYTKSRRLAIIGGSNGGLLMGATMTQHPELVKAVVSSVGIYDMLRVELSPNGSFNIPEFGTVKDLEQFRALYAYSPYHHVQDGAQYPPTLFLTGANDPRVDPMQSRKMTARLQAATGGKVPILLRTSANSGHGSGTALAEQIEQAVDIYAFLFNQLRAHRSDPFN